MKKRLLLILLVLLPLANVRAGGFLRPSFGLEWGYTGTFLRTWQHNFICNEGYRIIESDKTWRYFSNGMIEACAGVDIGGKVNASIYSGLAGVYFKRWMIPLEFRVRYCPSGLVNNGFICYAGAGGMFPTSTRTDTNLGFKLGGGYRVSVFRSISVDFLLSAHCTTDHDSIVDPDTKRNVPTLDITDCGAKYVALCASIAINF